MTDQARLREHARLLREAAAQMRLDPDTRWDSVADVLKAVARAVERSGVAHHPGPMSITERCLNAARTYVETTTTEETP